MKCLVVIAHPLADSLCKTLAARVVEALQGAGHQVEVEDLYASGFAGALTQSERASYYAGAYERTNVEAEVGRLAQAEGLVLVFPTWWFGFPAILKGWFDRVWVPGVAYDHAGDLGPIRPRLVGLRKALAITTLGSPWWVDRLVMRQPVKRVLSTAILGACAPNCRFQLLSLYRAERPAADTVVQFARRVERVLGQWH